jgi:AbrB family looped-hinge helix DNA binding protein
MKVMEEVRKSRITAKGQATIPKSVRDFLNVKPGDSVKFFKDAHGHVVILPVVPISKLRGIVKYTGKPVTIEEMDEGIAEAVGERYRRSLKDL